MAQLETSRHNISSSIQFYINHLTCSFHPFTLTHTIRGSWAWVDGELVQNEETLAIPTKISLSVSSLFCLYTLFLCISTKILGFPAYLDSSPFRVRSEGVSIITVRHCVTCHPLVHVLPTLSQDVFNNSAPFEIHLRRNKKKNPPNSGKCNRVSTLTHNIS